MATPNFIFGGGTGITYDDLQRRRKVLDALAARSSAPQNIGEGLNALGEGILGGIEERRLRTAKEKYDTAAATDYSAATSALSAPYTMASAGAPSASGTALAAAAPGATVGGETAELPSGDIYSGFIDTVRQGDQAKGLAGITNPYGLAAVAATGNRESGFSPGNVYRQWSDPSQSGQAGTAGGIMSWRAERLGAMRDFVAKNGGDPNRPSPQLQAQFFLSEDPGLVQRLNAAKSPEEAQELMNGAWKFAGYDDPNNPERNARIQTARSYAGQFAGQQQPVQMAAADPAAGNATPTMTDATAGRGAVVQAMGGQPQQQAAASPAVQRVAQAMPQPPQMGIPPEALRVLQNPASTPQQRAVVQALVEQRQAQAQAQYEQQMKLYQTQEQRAYETGVKQDERAYQTGVRQEGFAREDNRFAVTDANNNRDFAFKVEQGNKPPQSIQEYEYARGQGFQGTYADWEQANRKASATSIKFPDQPNIGTIPQGYEAVQNPETKAWSMRAIPGGPEDQSKKTAKAADNRTISSDIVTTASTRALEALHASGLPATGTFGAALSRLPESNAAELRRQVSVLQANARIENLQAMRDASPTGGALGAVSDSEGAMLASKSGTLDPSSPNFERDLLDYTKTLLRIVHGTKVGDAVFDQMRDPKGGQAGDTTTPDGEGWQTLPNGVKIREKR